ncbi:MAG: NAD(+)/NADH kinase [Succinivibrionaceae bacterium]|nr:NAD(+)/NADH kinase [Succinivibrionaceae bacterium]
MSDPIKSAVIVSKVYKRPVAGTIREIARILTSLGVETYLDQNTAVGFNIADIRSIPRKEMRGKSVIIVVGGDGSLLGAARTMSDLGVPFLGINGGHLGLLTDISPTELGTALTNVVAGRYLPEERMMLDVRVFRKEQDGAGELVGQSIATNETVIHSGMMAHMMVFHVKVDGRPLYTLRGDGIIVSTPTGSTAYSLSAGGPIIEPHLDLLSLVPMFPQSLNCSPIVISGQSVVQVEFDCSPDSTEWVAINCDGQVTVRADSSCIATMRQHRIPLRLIHPEGYDYFGVLRKKISWGQGLV